MNKQTVEHAGYLLSASASQNARGAWIPQIEISKDGAPVAFPDVETVQPEWLSCEEALRDGIDQARAFVDKLRRHSAE